MKYLSVGDMALSYQFRNHNAQLKQTMAKLSSEMTTGIKSDIGQAVAGDFNSLSTIDSSIAKMKSFSLATTEAGIITSTIQSTLAGIQNRAASAGASLVSVSQNADAASLNVTLFDAVEDFSAIISALNTSTSGKYIFSGTATGTASIASAEEILQALATEISGATSAEDITDRIKSWFDAPVGSGGFVDTAYNGSSQIIDGIRLSENSTASIPVTANDPAIKEALIGFSIAALVSKNMVPSDSATRSKLTNTAGLALIGSDTSLSVLQGSIGTMEQKIEIAKTSNETELSSLKISRNNLISIDDYETSTALKAIQTQLETLYTLTSQSSKLSLTNYI